MRKELKEMVKHLLPEPDCNDEEVVESYTATFEDIFKDHVQSLIDKYGSDIKSMEKEDPRFMPSRARVLVGARKKFVSDLKELIK